MRLGISSHTFPWSAGIPGQPQPARPLTAADLLEKAARLGVRVVQIADNLPLERLSHSELGALLRRAEALGITLELGTCGIDTEHLRASLDVASRLGANLLRLVLDTRHARPTPDEAVAALAAVLPDFERAGVTLAIENHDRFESRVLLDIVERAGTDRVGICFDTANSIGCLESAERVLDVLGRRVVNVHIKDYCVFRPPHNKGFVVEGRPAGRGQLDIPRLLERLRTLGRDPNVILELWPPPQPTLDESIALEHAWSEQSVAYLRTLIPE